MNQHLPIEQKVDAALNSLDGIQRAEANPYLYTRIRARMEKSQSGPAYSRMMIRLAMVLLVFLCINVITYSTMQPGKQQTQQGIEAFASDYELQSTSDNI